MPAMSKEKTAAVSLNDNNFIDAKYKELIEHPTIVTTMATTATVTSNSRLHQPRPESTASHATDCRNKCGCTTTAQSYADVVDSFHQNGDKNIANNNNNSTSDKKYLLNGHSSPLAQAIASEKIRPTSAYTNNSNDRNKLLSSASKSTVNKSGAKSTDSTPAPSKKTADDFIFGKIIGEGSFSSVYCALDTHTQCEYAIKVCEKDHIVREKKSAYILREKEAMSKLSNVPGFVDLLCTFQQPRFLFFAMTYAKNGDLLPYINKVGSFEIECARHYTAELVLACEEMHRRNIIHRDLKPENILLDNNMHILIGDFGSVKILTPEERVEAFRTLKELATKANSAENSSDVRNSKSRSRTRAKKQEKDDEDSSEETKPNEDSDDNASGSDDSESAVQGRPRHDRRRRGSFVGTAQYVSPEVLTNNVITPAADLWALGCIVYQMVSGLPPFRAANEHFLFKAILACKYEFPEGFDKDAADLVRKLLCINPAERLGILDEDSAGRYTSIRSHPFLSSVNFTEVRSKTPSPILPYIPNVAPEEDVSVKYQNMKPGLDDRQLTRLLGMDLGTNIDMDVIDDDHSNIDEVDSSLAVKHSTSPSSSRTISPQDRNSTSRLIANAKTAAANKSSLNPVENIVFNLSPLEKKKRLELQATNKWHPFAENEVILKQGFINKRKGLFARRRMMLLTTGPRLIYIDPVQMVKKGEIPWSPELRAEGRNFKIFFVITPNRTYYLEDTENSSEQWVEAIQKMHALTYNNSPAHRKISAHQQMTNQTPVVITPRTSTSN